MGIFGFWTFKQIEFPHAVFTFSHNVASEVERSAHHAVNCENRQEVVQNLERPDSAFLVQDQPRTGRVPKERHSSIAGFQAILRSM